MARREETRRAAANGTGRCGKSFALRELGAANLISFGGTSECHMDDGGACDIQDTSRKGEDAGDDADVL